MRSGTARHVVSIGLSAAIVSVVDERPQVLAVHHTGKPDALPFGPFDPLGHRTLDGGLRRWVKEQTFLDLGYAEQLYTFGDRGRHLVKPEDGPRVVSVGYLALTRATGELEAPELCGGTGTSTFHGRIGARTDRRSSTLSSRQLSRHSLRPQAQAWNPACVGRAPASPSAWNGRHGMKKKFSSDTNFFTKPDLWRKPAVTDAPAKFDAPQRSAIQ